MFEILKSELIADRIYCLEFKAPRVVRNCLPGQFVILRIDAEGERIPLTIADYDRESELLTLVYQVVGASTLRLSRLTAGDSVNDIAGPLGRPSDLTEKSIDELRAMKPVFIAGGVGIAPVYPQVKWLHEQGITAKVIAGARNTELLFWKEKLAAVSDLFVATDDGSEGFRGNTCDALKKLIADGEKFDLCVAIGPCIMMKFVCLLTKELGIPTVVSMNPIMVDGTGMCGACRLTVGDKVKFACVDGPEFDGHLVDFDEVMKRQKIYATEEGRAYLREKEGDTHHGGCGNCDSEEK